MIIFKYMKVKSEIKKMKYEPDCINRFLFSIPKASKLSFKGLVGKKMKIFS